MTQVLFCINIFQESLSLPPPSLASEYLTQEEATSFKKVKKKVRKIRKKPKVVTADDLLPLGNEEDMGSRRRRWDSLKHKYIHYIDPGRIDPSCLQLLVLKNFHSSDYLI